MMIRIAVAIATAVTVIVIVAAEVIVALYNLLHHLQYYHLSPSLHYKLLL